jgi:hypothetical protein
MPAPEFPADESELNVGTQNAKFEDLDEKFWSDRVSVVEHVSRLSLTPAPPLPPRRGRSIAAKLLFGALFLAALSLLVYEISILVAPKTSVHRMLPVQHS